MRLIKKDKLEFPGAQKAKISRSALRVSGEDIDRAVLAHIDEHTKGEAKPRLMAKSRDVFLPKGNLDYSIKSRGTYRKAGGYRTYEVTFKVDGKLIKKVPVRAYVKVFKEVYVAANTIKRNQLIQEADLQKIHKSVDRLPSNYVEDKSELVGKVARRTISSDEVLHNNALTTPPLVNVGDELTMVYETSAFRLESS